MSVASDPRYLSMPSGEPPRVDLGGTTYSTPLQYLIPVQSRLSFPFLDSGSDRQILRQRGVMTPLLCGALCTFSAAPHIHPPTHAQKCRIDDHELPSVMTYFSLLHGVTSPAYYGPDLDPYPATHRSNPSAPTLQNRPSTNVYFACPFSRDPQIQTSCHEHVAANCCPPCPHARASPVADLRWHPPPQHQRPRPHPLAHYVKHLYVLFFFTMTRKLEKSE